MARPAQKECALHTLPLRPRIAPFGTPGGTVLVTHFLGNYLLFQARLGAEFELDVTLVPHRMPDDSCSSTRGQLACKYQIRELFILVTQRPALHAAMHGRPLDACHEMTPVTGHFRHRTFAVVWTRRQETCACPEQQTSRGDDLAVATRSARFDNH